MNEGIHGGKNVGTKVNNYDGHIDNAIAWEKKIPWNRQDVMHLFIFLDTSVVS